MSLPGYLAFLAVSLTVICTPGQDTALTIRNTLAGGRAAGIATALGVSAGQAVWTLATAAGLALLVTQAEPVFTALRIAGAVYLVYLGVRMLRSRPHAQEEAPRRRGSSFAQGLLSNLSNAKMVAFFVSLLPQFAGSHASFALLIALGLNFSLLTLAWLSAYAFAVERIGRVLGAQRVRLNVDRVAGAVLVALGLRVGADALATA
jgi:threonine/homoserine/homoserine lactone efflux protein